jgi:hypothetical protein
LELFENTYVQIWLGVGFVTAMLGLIIDKNMYHMSAGEFKDDEFSVGFFLLVIAVGPIGLVFVLLSTLKEAAGAPGRKKANKELYAQLEAGRKAAAEKEREAKEAKKEAARDFMSNELAVLMKEMDSGSHEEPVIFLQKVVSLGSHARALTLKDVTDAEKCQIVSLIRYARINASSLAAGVAESEQVKLVKALSDELVKLTKKYKKALEVV